MGDSRVSGLGISWNDNWADFGAFGSFSFLLKRERDMEVRDIWLFVENVEKKNLKARMDFIL